MNFLTRILISDIFQYQYFRYPKYVHQISAIHCLRLHQNHFSTIVLQLDLYPVDEYKRKNYKSCKKTKRMKKKKLKLLKK